MKTIALFALLLVPALSQGQHFISGTDTTDILATYKTKNFSITDPVQGDNLMGHIWEVGREFTITKVVTVLQGSSSQSVTWSLKHHTNRSSATPFELVNNGSTTTSTTIGNTISSFNNAVVGPNEFIWITISATAGVVDAIHFTVYYHHTVTPQ